MTAVRSVPGGISPDGGGLAGGAPAPRPRSRFVRLYGSSPWHLVAIVLCLAVSAYVVLLIVDDPALTRIAVWFLGVAVVWDLVLGPLLALGDRLLRPLARVGALNHVRVPALASLVLLLVWAPVILKRSEGTFRVKAGLGQDVFLGRWLTITAVLFAVSGLLWVTGRLRSRRGSRPATVGR